MRTQAQKWPGAINVTLGDGTGGTVTSVSLIFTLFGRRGMSLVWTWLSTLVCSSILIEISNNYDERRPSEARWTPVTDPAITAYLAAAPAASPPGGLPSGVAGSAALQIDPVQATAMRVTFARASSSGALVVDLKTE